MSRTLLLLLGIFIFTVAVVPASAQKSKKKEATPTTQSTIKEILAQHEGEMTNLGTLKRVSGDYFVVDDEGTTSMHPLSTLHTLRFVKDEETGKITLEIRLVAKD
jgi:hypothetical protein